MAQLAHCFQVETEIGISVSVEGGKPEDAEKNPQSKDKYQRQTQPTWDARARNRTRATVGGKRALSPLRHPYFPDI